MERKNALIPAISHRAFLGALLLLFGLALYALSDTFVKYLIGSYSVAQTTFLRALVRLPPFLLFLCFQENGLRSLQTKHPMKHLVRLLVSACYTYAFMSAFSKNSLSIVYTLSYVSPLFLIVLSALFLKEKVGGKKWMALGLGMLGVCIALRPGSEVFELGSLFVLLAVFLGALNKILMKHLSKTESSLSLVVYPNVFMVVALLPWMFSVWQAPSLRDWFFFAALGLFAAGGQYAIAQALRLTQVSLLAPLDYSSFFWIVWLEYLCWGQFPSLYVLLGTVVIVASNLYILLKMDKNESLTI